MPHQGCRGQAGRADHQQPALGLCASKTRKCVGAHGFPALPLSPRQAYEGKPSPIFLRCAAVVCRPAGGGDDDDMSMSLAAGEAARLRDLCWRGAGSNAGICSFKEIW